MANRRRAISPTPAISWSGAASQPSCPQARAEGWLCRGGSPVVHCPVQWLRRYQRSQLAPASCGVSTSSMKAPLPVDTLSMEADARPRLPGRPRPRPEVDVVALECDLDVLDLVVDLNQPPCSMLVDALEVAEACRPGTSIVVGRRVEHIPHRPSHLAHGALSMPVLESLEEHQPQHSPHRRAGNIIFFFFF